MWLCLSFVPRLSPRANEKSKVTESWAGPRNEASFVYSAQQDEYILPCLPEILIQEAFEIQPPPCTFQTCNGSPNGVSIKGTPLHVTCFTQNLCQKLFSNSVLDPPPHTHTDTHAHAHTHTTMVTCDS